MRILSDGPTGHTLTYRGNKYDQQKWVRGSYPANLWLTYRGLRYRPAATELNASNNLIHWNRVQIA